ncbi:uncharacterized protein LOC143295111 [Babylonia areolata]|uniref:uncharacterized protein LOC143295111 n=1 Tax=Babylonia areolata TaxID=304850 RepID=UPI003FD3022B
MTTDTVISRLKNIFAHHGIPETLMSNNGRQFTSVEFQKFADKWNFTHCTSSPYFPISNGEAERAVKTAKRILDQEDPFEALLSYRATPTGPTGASPAELAMGRRLRTTLPTLQSNLEPQLYDKNVVKQNDAKAKFNNKKNFDKHHGAVYLPELQPGDHVLQKLDHESRWSNSARVVSQVAPRSYLIETPAGTQLLFLVQKSQLKPVPQSRDTPRSMSRPAHLIPYPQLPQWLILKGHLARQEALQPASRARCPAKPVLRLRRRRFQSTRKRT